MSEEFDSIMRGLLEAVDDALGKTSLKREIIQLMIWEAKLKTANPIFQKLLIHNEV